MNKNIRQNAEPRTEMARIRQTKTGLSMIVWLNPNDGTNSDSHNMPSLKFQDNTDTRFIPSDMITISIHPFEPTILVKGCVPKLPSQTITQLKQWIMKNYSVLISYWNNEIYEDDLMDKIQPV